MTASHLDENLMTAWQQTLLEIGAAVRTKVRQAWKQEGGDLAAAVAHEGGDTIYAVDRHVEPIIIDRLEALPDEMKPLLLVAEGMGADGQVSIGGDSPRYCVIIDPIDGTRNIMYDKRAAWFVAAVAEMHADQLPTLRDSFVSVIVEIPPSKAGWADSFSARRGLPTTGQRVRIDAGEDSVTELHATPSQSDTLLHGFGQVANFFPGTKVLGAQLMEAIAEAVVGPPQPGQASIFDDQYMSTGGQFVELLTGRDRFICDLRPLFYDAIGQEQGQVIRGLECHPYDAGGLLVAEQAGVIVTDGFGRPLDAPMDVDTGVHWCGYGNRKLQQKIEPVIRQFFEKRGVVAEN